MIPIRTLATLAVLLLAAVPAWAQGTPTAVQHTPQHLDTAVSVQHSHTSAATITLTNDGANYIYITAIDISNCAGTAVTAAAPTFITTTGITGAPQYMLGSGSTAGLCQPFFVSFPNGLKSSSPGVNVTFVLPAFVTQQTASVNVYFYKALAP